MEGKNPQTYVITPLDLNNVQLRSGPVLQIKPLIIIQEMRPNLQRDKINLKKERPLSIKKKIIKQKMFQ